MHTSYKSFNRRRMQAASERGRKMANARWKNERARQAAIAAADPLRVTGRILRRIIVIDRLDLPTGETMDTVREAVIYDFDSLRSARRKLRGVLMPIAMSPECVACD
jgi:hypothetical protein